MVRRAASLSASRIIYTRLLRAHVRRCVIGGTGALPLVARQCFPELARYIPGRHDRLCRSAGLTLPCTVFSDFRFAATQLSVFALIYAITTRDAFSSSRASGFVILCPDRAAYTRAANCGNGVGSLVRFSRKLIVVLLNRTLKTLRKSSTE